MPPAGDVNLNDREIGGGELAMELSQNLSADSSLQQTQLLCSPRLLSPPADMSIDYRQISAGQPPPNSLFDANPNKKTKNSLLPLQSCNSLERKITYPSV